MWKQFATYCMLLLINQCQAMSDVASNCSASSLELCFEQHGVKASDIPKTVLSFTDLCIQSDLAVIMNKCHRQKDIACIEAFESTHKFLLPLGTDPELLFPPEDAYGIALQEACHNRDGMNLDCGNIHRRQEVECLKLNKFMKTKLNIKEFCRRSKVEKNCAKTVYTKCGCALLKLAVLAGNYPIICGKMPEIKCNPSRSWEFAQTQISASSFLHINWLLVGLMSNRVLFYAM